MGTQPHPPSLPIAFFDIHTLPAEICSQHILHPSGLTTAVRTRLRDLSLITGRGGNMKFCPYKKGRGGGKGFSHAERGAQQVLG